MEYRGYEIRMFESENVRTQKPDGSTFSVRNSGGLVFYARSKFGDSFARDSESALEGARKQIDDALGGG